MDVRLEDKQPSAGLQNAVDLSQDCHQLVLRPQVLEEVAREDRVDGLRFEARQVSCGLQNNGYVFRRGGLRIVAEIDCVLLGAADIVDELAVPGAQVDDSVRLSHILLEERLAEYLPKCGLALSLGGAVPMLVQIAQRVRLGLSQLPPASPQARKCAASRSCGVAL